MGFADVCFSPAASARINARINARSPLIAPHSYSFSNGDLTSLRHRDGMHTSGEPFTQAKDVSSRFGRRLRELRLQRNLTQLNMAKKFGIDRSFISDVERGRKSISLTLLEVIAIGLDVSLSTLFENL